jgi:site-specific recombinase XerD
MVTDREEPRNESHLVGEIARIYRRGRVWWLNAQFGGRQHRESLRTTSEKEARRRAVKIEGELLTNGQRQKKNPPNVDEAIDAYIDYLHTERRARKTLVKYAAVLKRVRALLHRRRATSILGLDLLALDDYRRERVAAKVAAKTLYTETIIVRQLVNFCCKRGMIAGDPLRGLKVREPKPTPQPCWSEQEVESILAASPQHYVAALTILADTGMRVGELRHLTWSDVDLPANVLRIRAKDDWVPKSGDERAIPMTPRVRKLVEHMPRRGRWVVASRPTSRYPEVGRQLSERRLLQALKRVLKRLNLEGHLHTFRHSFISRCLMKGIPEAVVRDVVGHVDSEILKLYTHIASQESQAAIHKFARATPAEGTTDGLDSAQVQHNREEGTDGPREK